MYCAYNHWNNRMDEILTVFLTTFLVFGMTSSPLDNLLSKAGTNAPSLCSSLLYTPLPVLWPYCTITIHFISFPGPQSPFRQEPCFVKSQLPVPAPISLYPLYNRYQIVIGSMDRWIKEWINRVFWSGRRLRNNLVQYKVFISQIRKQSLRAVKVVSKAARRWQVVAVTCHFYCELKGRHHFTLTPRVESVT